MLSRARNGMTGLALTPVLPEAAPGGSLSAHSGHSSQPLESAKRMASGDRTQPVGGNCPDATGDPTGVPLILGSPGRLDALKSLLRSVARGHGRHVVHHPRRASDQDRAPPSRDTTALLVVGLSPPLWQKRSERRHVDSSSKAGALSVVEARQARMSVVR
jgi:hypothetical protein